MANRVFAAPVIDVSLTVHRRSCRRGDNPPADRKEGRINLARAALGASAVASGMALDRICDELGEAVAAARSRHASTPSPVAV